MIKRLLIYSFVATMMVALPVCSHATTMCEPNAPEMVADQAVSVTVSQSVINVSGAAGKTLEIVSLTGKQMASVKIESPSQRIELNLPKGCYILKVGNIVRKVSIR